MPLLLTARGARGQDLRHKRVVSRGIRPKTSCAPRSLGATCLRHPDGCPRSDCPSRAARRCPPSRSGDPPGAYSWPSCGRCGRLTRSNATGSVVNVFQGLTECTEGGWPVLVEDLPAALVRDRPGNVERLVLTDQDRLQAFPLRLIGSSPDAVLSSSETPCRPTYVRAPSLSRAAASTS